MKEYIMKKNSKTMKQLPGKGDYIPKASKALNASKLISQYSNH